MSSVRIRRGPLDILQEHHELRLASCGYESRSIALIDRFVQPAPVQVALGYNDGQVLSYSSNVTAFRRYRWRLETVDDDGFDEAVRSALIGAIEGRERPRVMIDISTMNRRRIALCVQAAIEVSASRGSMTVDFVYSPAKFAGVPRDGAPITYFGPVLPRYAGAARSASTSVGAVLGVGYEPARASGILEVLEPKAVWVFCPVGADRRYYSAMRRANAAILREESSRRIVDYEVGAPTVTFELLEALVSGVTEEHRVVLVPLGPKIFSLLAVLVSEIQERRPAVWRCTSGPFEAPVDRQAQGSPVCITVDVSAT